MILRQTVVTLIVFQRTLQTDLRYCSNGFCSTFTENEFRPDFQKFGVFQKTEVNTGFVACA